MHFPNKLLKSLKVSSSVTTCPNACDIILRNITAFWLKALYSKNGMIASITLFSVQ